MLYNHHMASNGAWWKAAVWGWVVILQVGCKTSQTLKEEFDITAPPYRNFTHQPGSMLNIEFEFPSEWGEMKVADVFLLDIGIIEGGKLIIVNPRTGENPCGIDVDENGSDTCEQIHLEVSSVYTPDDWAEIATAMSLEDIENDPSEQLVENSPILIDGLPARMITYYSEGDEYVGFESYYVFTYVQRKGIGYIFHLSFIRPDQLNGEFHQAFIELLSTIRFVD